MRRHLITILLLAFVAVPIAAQIEPEEEGPAKGITVVVTGRAPCVPDVLEVRTTVTATAATAAGAEQKFGGASKTAHEALAKLPATRIEVDKAEIDPPTTQSDDGQQVFVGGGGRVIIRGGLFGGSVPEPPNRFTARQRFVLRRTGLARLPEAERLKALAAALDALRTAKLPVGSAASQTGMNDLVIWNWGAAASIAPQAPENVPTPPIRFLTDATAAEAAASRDALAEARALASTLADVAGRKLGKPTTITVIRSTPPPAGSAKGGDHVVEMKVVFELL